MLEVRLCRGEGRRRRRRAGRGGRHEEEEEDAPKCVKFQQLPKQLLTTRPPKRASCKNLAFQRPPAMPRSITFGAQHAVGLAAARAPADAFGARSSGVGG